MIAKEIIIRNKPELESKLAALFIQKAVKYKSNIWVEKEDRKTNGKSLLGLLSLGIGNGIKIVLTVEGEDEIKATQELEDYLCFESKENT